MAIGSRWRTLRLHVTLALLLPTFLLLGYWQLRRALGGNGLSWAYTFEWPIFAVYAIVLWWRLWGEDAASSPLAGVAQLPESLDEARDQAEADEREAYNSYLEQLRQEDDAKQRRAR